MNTAIDEKTARSIHSDVSAIPHFVVSISS
jgi:hypothetical protein